MIKAKVTAEDGVPVYLFGLSRGNINKLTAGQPIVVDLRVMGGPALRVAIAFGETEEALAKEIMEKLGNPEHSVDERQGG